MISGAPEEQAGPSISRITRCTRCTNLVINLIIGSHWRNIGRDYGYNWNIYPSSSVNQIINQGQTTRDGVLKSDDFILYT